MFKEHGYDVIIPPAYRAKRTICIRRLNKMILENEEEYIIQELNNKNQWAKVQSRIKFSGRRNMKVAFTDAAMVTKAMEKGLLCCNMSVTLTKLAVSHTRKL